MFLTERRNLASHSEHAAAVGAVRAAVMWNAVFLPSEQGPVLPVDRSWDLSKVRKTPSFEPFIVKCTILPRQALDKHIEGNALKKGSLLGPEQGSEQSRLEVHRLPMGQPLRLSDDGTRQLNDREEACDQVV